MATETKAGSGGIGFAGLLAILFIALKLTEVIDWSWWWVLAPIWIPMSIGLFVLMCVLVSCRICLGRWLP